MRCNIDKAEKICDALEPAITKGIHFFQDRSDTSDQIVRSRAFHLTALSFELFVFYIKEYATKEKLSAFESYLKDHYKMFVSKEYFSTEEERETPEVRFYIGNGEPGSFITQSYVEKYYANKEGASLKKRDEDCLELIFDRVALFVKNNGYDALSELFEKYLGLIGKSEDWYDEDTTDFAFKILEKNSIFDLFGRDLKGELKRLFV